MWTAVTVNLRIVLENKEKEFFLTIEGLCEKEKVTKEEKEFHGKRASSFSRKKFARLFSKSASLVKEEGEKEKKSSGSF